MFTIAADLRAVFPQVFALALRVSDLDAASLGQTTEGLERASEQFRQSLPADAAIAELPEVRVWREAYAVAGVKPSKYRSSIEALLRRAAKGAVPPVLPLVDLYNAVSLRHRVPLGAADADLLRDPVALRLCA